MRQLCLLLALAVLLPASLASAATVVAPNSLETTEGPSNNCFPFTCTSEMRYQQGYDSDQFPLSPISISQIAFRVDGGPLAESFTRQIEVQINLSTSVNPVGGLSTTFANNIGADELVVFSQQTILLSGTHEGGPGPNPFDVIFALEQGFEYDPTQGDLLMDVRLFSAVQVVPPLENPILDSTSIDTNLHRIYWNNDVDSTFGTSDPNAGLVTQFTYTVVPEPTTALLLGLGLSALGARRRTPQPRGASRS